MFLCVVWHQQWVKNCLDWINLPFWNNFIQFSDSSSSKKCLSQASVQQKSCFQAPAPYNFFLTWAHVKKCSSYTQNGWLYTGYIALLTPYLIGLRADLTFPLSNLRNKKGPSRGGGVTFWKYLISSFGDTFWKREFSRQGPPYPPPHLKKYPCTFEFLPAFCRRPHPYYSILQAE